MNYNLPEMQANIRAEFEAMLQYVTSEEAQTATADQIEKSLFQLLLNLGVQLLFLFFQMRSQTSSRKAIIAEGQRFLITASKNESTSPSSGRSQYGDLISMRQERVDTHH